MMTASTIAGRAKGKAGKHQPTDEVMVSIVKNVGAKCRGHSPSCFFVFAGAGRLRFCELQRHVKRFHEFVDLERFGEWVKWGQVKWGQTRFINHS